MAALTEMELPRSDIFGSERFWNTVGKGRFVKGDKQIGLVF